tara:strand:+ start:292 stop:540 length:249 start_codon:yes stop_codon:yes gene_type:complete
MNKTELYEKFEKESLTDLLKYKSNIRNIYNNLETIEEKHNLILDYVCNLNPNFILIKQKYENVKDYKDKNIIIMRLMELWGI